MDETSLSPFSDDAAWLLRHSKLPLHIGVGTVERHGNPDHPLAQMVHRFRQASGQPEPAKAEFAASFLVPATGNCRVFLRSPGDDRLNRDFGEGLIVEGDSPDGRFRLFCPRYYVKATSEMREKPGWAVASPTNEPAVISYGDPRPIATITATINNFDFEYGNIEVTSDQGDSKVLRVEAAGRLVDFEWRRERVQLRRLVDAGVIATTSFVNFSFAAWPDASDEELTEFADNISTLCSYVAGQHTGVPILTFFDTAGRIVRRTLRGVVESKFRNDHALRGLHFDNGLPQLFRQCFGEHCRMRQSDLWQRLPFLYAVIEDPPYLEQKYATLMMAVELLIRASLVEGGHLSLAEVERKTLPDLIGLARGTLRWTVPKHYTEGGRYLMARNAVVHGGSLPHDIRQIWFEFAKWKLLLIRRLFIRMGFDGEVASPQKGWASSSSVDEFSEEHNSFRN